MADQLPEYFQSLLTIQEGFFLRPDPTRRLPAVLDHLVNPDRLEHLTREIARLNPKALELRLSMLSTCFEGISDLENHLLELYARYFSEESPLNGCSRDVKIAAAAAIIQAFPYEGLACFNPAIAPHPIQNGPDDGSLRIVLALRSYGEYHRSSISFRTGRIDAGGRIRLDGTVPTASGMTPTRLPEVEGNRFFFPPEGDLNQFVLYGPFLGDVDETWEDVRFTRFEEPGDYEGCYFGTFTSFNFTKRRLMPCLLLTRDFYEFEYMPLRGAGAEDKDLAFFPKKIKDRFAMLSRNNGRDLFLMTSEDPFTFKKRKRIAQCRHGSFDAHKMGVCAPPLETEEGWLVIYHGVTDPGQIYSLGVMLLDLEDPSKVVARLPYTLHHPLVDTQKGMLSTILYTCGALIHGSSRYLVVPYAVNDTYCKAGRISLEEILARLKEDG